MPKEVQQAAAVPYASESRAAGFFRGLGVIVAVAYTALVTWLSLLPSASFDLTGPCIPHIDKVAHFLMYGGYVVALSLGAGLRRGLRFGRMAGAVVFASSYGVLMEFAQAWLRPGDRGFSFGDMAANALGALAFSVLMVHNRRILKRCVQGIKESRAI
jgi:hypothetical protein